MEFNESLLRSWLNFIHLEDKAAAEIKPVTSGVLKKINACIGLKGNRLFIGNKDVFDDVTDYLKKRGGNAQEQISLSFPCVYVRDRKIEVLKPLFIVNLEDIFTGEYLNEGWDLIDLEASVSSLNIQEALQLDEEELENIFIGDSLLSFINSTFSIRVNDLEEACVKLAESCHTYYPRRQKSIEAKPYMFEYRGTGFNTSLRRDLIYIINKQKKELKNKNNLLSTYISNKKPLSRELFYGALGKFPPTPSQADVIYNSVSNKILAAKGPPGTGKTTLILNIVAHQIVETVTSLIDGKESNGLIVITSTNNRAVQNAVEQLIELTRNKVKGELCLQGGRKVIIKNHTLRAIKEKINFLQNEEFNEEKFDSLANEVKRTKETIIGQVSDYRKLAAKVKKYQSLIAKMNMELLGLNEQKKKNEEEFVKLLDIAFNDTTYRKEYLNEIDWITYHQANDILVRYVQSFPRIFDWFKFRSKRHIARFNEEMKDLVSKTLGYFKVFRLNSVSSEEELLSLQKRVFSLIQIRDFNETIENIVIQTKTLVSDLEDAKKKENKAKKDIEAWLVSLSGDKEKAKELVSKLEFIEEDIFSFYHDVLFKENMELFYLSLDYLWQYLLKKKDIYIGTLEKYGELLSDNSGGLFRELLPQAHEFYLNLSKVFPVFSTTLQSVGNMFKYSMPGIINKVIVDEAGMVKNYQVAPLFFRANSALVVGDPLQIPPVITHGKKVLQEYDDKEFLKDFRKANKVNEEVLGRYISSYSPSHEKGTVYHLAATKDFMADNARNKYWEIQLKEHFRCQKDIADYFDKICNYGLNVMTPSKPSRLGVNMLAYHVEGKMKEKANVDEIDAVVALIKHLIKQGYSIGENPDEGIGVITPYRVHGQWLKEKLGNAFPEFKKSNNRIGTIHTFQGGEKDVIICSTRIFSRNHSDFFLNKSPNLLNVAVSRAKELFILVGNLDKLRSAGGYTGELVEHIEDRGEILEINTLTELAKEKLAKSNVTVISDCEHIEAFNSAVNKAKEDLIIVSPWIRGGAGRHLVNLLQEKRVPVTIMYGWSEDDSQDEDILKELRKLRHVTLIDCRVAGQGTHEKILITDRKQAIVGSWNWLSHKYYMACKKRDRLDNLAVRHETSAVIYDEEEIGTLIKTLTERAKFE